MLTRKQVKREAKQLFRLCLTNGSLDEDCTRTIVRSAIAAGGRDCPAVLSHFLRLVRLDRAQHTASIESAVPLPADLQAVVQSDLSLVYGPGLHTIYAHRPSLIGGMRIQVGCDVYDGSVLAKLAILEKCF